MRSPPPPLGRAFTSVVFIPENLERPKIVASAIYDTTLVAVRGTYDDVNKLASEIAAEEEGWAFVNVNVRPYYAEGSKTLAFEIAEQLGWRIPDQIVVPVASGAQLTKIDKGFRELISLGLVEDKPFVIFGAQATGCSPVAQAFRANQDWVAPVRPDTIAKSLAIGNPATGRTCWTWSAGPVAWWLTSTTRRWSRTSSAWLGPRASSPRPPVASRWG
jgi:threonine synthase